MRRPRSRLFLAFALAGLVGAVFGYGNEAGARDRGAVARRDHSNHGRFDAAHRGPDLRRPGAFGSVRLSEGYRERRSSRDRLFRAHEGVFGNPSVTTFAQSFGDRPDRRGDRGRRFSTHGSITRVAPFEASSADRFEGGFGVSGDDAFSGEDSASGIAIRGFPESYFNGGSAYEGGDDGADASFSAGGPKIIDIASARLDRRPIGPEGIETLNAGGAKIIRIAPDYRMAGREAGRDDAEAESGDRQPWSSGWLHHCRQTHRSFDPSLGTFEDRDGKVRFCQPD